MPLIEYYGLLFEWHDKKLQAVYNGREITLEEACSVFSDDYAITFLDADHPHEQRLLTVGMSKRNRLLSVAWVERGEVGRIITAFKPSVIHKRSYNHAKRS